MSWRDREGWLNCVFCDDGWVVDERERDGGWRWEWYGGYERIWEIRGTTCLIGLGRPRIGVSPRPIGTRSFRIGDGQLTRTRNSLSPSSSWWYKQKTFPSGRNGSVRVDPLRQSRYRHTGGGLLRARRQYHASCCTSPSDRSFAISSSDSARAFSDASESTCSYGGAFRTLRDLTIRIVKFWRSLDRCPALRETWCRILKTVVLRVPLSQGISSIIFVFVTVTRFATS